MDHLKLENTFVRDSSIKFKEIGHIYNIIDQLIDDTREFTSVTTFIHTLFTEFDSDAVICKMKASLKWTKSKYYGMTDEEIKSLWETLRSTAALAGTKLHLDIEKFYNKQQVSNNSIEYKFFLNYEKERDKILLPYRTEWNVWDEDLRLAGSIDMVYIHKKTKNLHIYDWKRCKDIKKYSRWDFSNNEFISHIPDTNYWHYVLQLNIYREILQRKYNQTVDELAIICLHPIKNNYIKIDIPLLPEEISDLLNYRINLL
jgi:ATP-dependent exoDNAse (exonuclease V) beta subunit